MDAELLKLADPQTSLRCEAIHERPHAAGELAILAIGPSGALRRLAGKLQTHCYTTLASNPAIEELKNVMRRFLNRLNMGTSTHTMNFVRQIGLTRLVVFVAIFSGNVLFISWLQRSNAVWAQEILQLLAFLPGVAFGAFLTIFWRREFGHKTDRAEPRQQQAEQP